MARKGVWSKEGKRVGEEKGESPDQYHARESNGAIYA
jgi:hypothetical protein